MKLQFSLQFHILFLTLFASRLLDCEADDCPRASRHQMGHGFCAAHCACLSKMGNVYVYDPYRCNVCLDFIKRKFQGVDDADCIKAAEAELEAHVKKLRRYLESLDGRPSLKFSSFVAELRNKCRLGRSKVLDLDFFRTLSIREESNTDDDIVSVVSIPPSVSSGSPR